MKHKIVKMWSAISLKINFAVVIVFCNQEFQENFGIISLIFQKMAPVHCAYCDHTTSSLRKYKNHLHSNHPGKKPFLCDACGNSYMKKSKLEDHTEIEHVRNGESVHICHYCVHKPSFKYKYHLDSHIREKHEVLTVPDGDCSIKIKNGELDKKLICLGYQNDLSGRRRCTRKPKIALDHQLYINICNGSLEKDYFEKIQFGKPKGFGVVAKKMFPINTYLLEYTGDLINRLEADQRENEYTDDHAYRFDFSAEGRAVTLDAARNDGRFGRLLNHSKLLPNLVPVVMPNLIGKDRVLFRTISHINEGEELVWDYNENRPEVLKANPWLENS